MSYKRPVCDIHVTLALLNFIGEIPICNLNNLVYALQEQVSSHWYPFGLSLGVPKQILEQLT